MPNLFVLMFHDIVDDNSQLSTYSGANIYHVEKKVFSEFILQILNSGITIKTFDELNKTTINDDIALITFDDGLKGVYSIVLPFFKKHNIRGILFITKNFIGKKNFLSEAQLIELVEYGFELGIHGTTHKYLTECDDTEIRKEIGDCKLFLEKIAGKPIKIMALPGGGGDERVYRIACDMGIEKIFTSHPGKINKIDDLLLNRITISSRTTYKDLKRYLGGDFVRERLKWNFLQIPRKLIGDKNYASIRRRVFSLLGKLTKSDV